MNQHMLVKIPERRTVQLGTPHRCVANLGKAQNTRFTHGASLSLAKAGPMSGAQPMNEVNALAGAIALGLTCAGPHCLPGSPAPGPAVRHFPYAAE
jgi:hypothetical protein